MPSSCPLDLAEVRPDLGSEQATEQEDRQDRDEDRLDREPADHQQRHERDGQGRETERQSASRLLALDHERGREDRVGEEDHRHETGKAHRRGDRLVDDETQGRANQEQDAEGVQKEETDTAGHLANALEHRAHAIAQARHGTPAPGHGVLAASDTLDGEDDSLLPVTVETPDWVRDAVFYQIFPDRFAASARVPKPGPLEPWDAPPTVHGFKGGDLLGVVEHLDHLERLGVNAVYFNPVFASASNHRYHTYDYLAVDPLLGGEAALRELLDACHERGMRVVLDGVFNHASRGFWPFHHVLETGVASPYRDWFYFNAEHLAAGRPIRAYPDETIGHALDVSDVNEEQRRGAQSLQVLGYQAWWDMPALPKINVDNPNARAYLLGVAEHWIRFGIDGWRLDVATEVPDEFWREFRRHVRAINPEAYIVAEIWRERPEYLQGDMYDALMNYPLAEAIISFVGGERIDRRVVAQHDELGANIRPEDGPAFAGRLERAMTVYDPVVTSAMLNLLDSHDTPRLLSMLGGDAGGVALATFVLMTLPGAPSIFYGDEIGMSGEMDPYCRAAMRWDESTWDRELYQAMSGAIALRRANAALRGGSFGLVRADGPWCAWRRDDDAGTFVVVANAGDAAAIAELPLPELPGRHLVAEPWRGAGGSALAVTVGDDGVLRLTVAARDGLALRVAP